VEFEEESRLEVNLASCRTLAGWNHSWGIEHDSTALGSRFSPTMDEGRTEVRWTFSTEVVNRTVRANALSDGQDGRAVCRNIGFENPKRVGVGNLQSSDHPRAGRNITNIPECRWEFGVFVHSCTSLGKKPRRWWRLKTFGVGQIPH
jgi:hypothetical protein